MREILFYIILAAAVSWGTVELVKSIRKDRNSKQEQSTDKKDPQ